METENRNGEVEIDLRDIFAILINKLAIIVLAAVLGAAVAFTLQDLVLVAQIIQLTSQRGAFKAEELSQVGGLYNKLITFLQSAGALTPASTEEKENA